MSDPPGTGAAASTGPRDGPDEEQIPYPPRYWWLKRLCAAALVLVVLVVGLRWWVTRRAQAAFDAMLAASRSAGLRVSVGEFAARAIPDELNAADYFTRASTAIVPSIGDPRVPQHQLSMLCSDPDLLRANPDAVAELLAANGPALALIEAGCAAPECDWGVVLGTPVFATVLPSLSGQRENSRLLRLRAGQVMLTGDHAAAIRMLHQGLVLARRVEEGSVTFLVSHFTAAAIANDVCADVEWIAPRLAVASGGAAEAGAVDRREVEHLVARLLDEAWIERGWLAAMEAERFCQIDAFDAIARGQAPPGAMLPGGWSGALDAGSAVLGKPLWLYSAVRLVRYIDGVTRVGAAQGLAEAPPLPPATSTERPGLPGLVSKVENLFRPALERAVFVQYRTRARHRLAAAVLAIRLFELDHGRHPASLRELVPVYLPDVPVDPFSRPSAPLLYRPEASPPLLYSVGEDGRDDYPAPRRDGEVMYLNGDRPRDRPREPQAGPASAPSTTGPSG